MSQYYVLISKFERYVQKFLLTDHSYSMSRYSIAYFIK